MSESKLNADNIRTYLNGKEADIPSCSYKERTVLRQARVAIEALRCIRHDIGDSSFKQTILTILKEASNIYKV